jgi:hypothetical protein
MLANRLGPQGRGYELACPARGVRCVGYGYASRFMSDLYAASREGRLPTHFRAADVSAACPGWAEWTYRNLLPKHRLGNPMGYTE